ncbi:MAG TPA: exosortase, partial [Candidatus Saccharimonadales bacterium]|nr:exosortase [Candidatus Saccharimonadales bacterium]
MNSSSPPLLLRRQLKYLALFAGGLMICFALSLWHLLRFCLQSDLFSYIPLIPCISLYLVWLKKETISAEGKSLRSWAALPALAAAGALAGYWAATRSGWHPVQQETLSVMMLAFLLFFWAGCLFFLKTATVRQIIFPIAFLAFIVPLPPFMVEVIDGFFQYTSAAMAGAFFTVAGTPFFQDGLQLHLPDITLRVAPECSGIHSTVVLLITSLLGGYLFLPAVWKRAVLVLFIVPLAIMRNGFRVFVIGELCVHIGPQMIESPIHRRGGPIFFALSLIPLFLLLFFLRRVGSKNPQM